MGAPKDDDSLDAKRQWCIDPENSVVVTACAGSGKTWLLTSRILRIILNDPKCEQLHRILAITFTNNAAAEIQTRVRERLHKLAYEKDEEERKKLFERIGVPPKKRSDVASIYRTFLTKRPTLSVFTFHSWFSHLIHFLPWSARTSLHTRVVDSPEHLKRRAWEQMLESIDDKSEEAKSMRFLLGLHKLRALQEIMVNVIDSRAEWYLYFDNCLPEDEKAFARFQKKKKPKKECTRQQLLKNKVFLRNLDKLADEMVALKEKNKLLSNARDKLKKAPEQGADGFFKTVHKIVIEQCTVGPDVKKHGGEGLKDCLAKIVSDIETVKATDAYIYDKHCARIGTFYAQQYTKLKEQEGVIDYADMEIIPLRVLIEGTDSNSKKKEGSQDLAEGGDSESQDVDHSQGLTDFFKHLDDTYEHILVDEFQDTNPVQWRMLRAWLQESNKSDNPNDKPSVFIVGDPKQSVYGWRGGNPKLLGVARNYLEKNYGADAVSINYTRRCSQKIVDAVNKTFSSKGDWSLDNFATHEIETEKQKDDSSMILCFQPEELPSDKKSESTLRNPLFDRANEKDESDLKATREGEMLAGKIKKILNKGYARKDIMILHPKRSESEYLIEALAGKGLACSQLDRSSRMDCLECQDILALLHAIFDPRYGLMVAQVLRSPIFGVSDEDLWKVYQAGLSVSEKDGKKYCSWMKGLYQVKDGSADLKEAQKMLGTWRENYLNQKLPAHELLAQCYAHRYREANLIERYVKAVPQDIAKRVVLNLDWILNYSLEAQGGRLVLPSEYAAHLRELSEAGEKTDLAAEGDRVIRSLTVHGAKGLESKVVIVINSDYETKKQWDKLLLTWNLEELCPSHFSFCRNSDYPTDCQKRAWEEIKKDREQEKNNLLYVAMTRARQHLFFSKRPIKTKEKPEAEKEPKKANKKKAAKKGAKPKKAKLWDHVKKSSGNLDEKELVELQPADKDPDTDGSDSDKIRRWPPGRQDTIKVGKQKEADNESKIKGTQRHNLLALILQNEKTYEKVMKDDQLLHRRLLGIGKERLAELHGEIKEILAPETEFGKLLAQVDKKKNPIECELSAIVAGEHKDQVKIRRIDCLLTTKDDVVWIIDFKTGGSAFEDEHKNEYDEQLRAYHSVVKGSHLKDKTIKMAIVDREGGMREVQPA